MKKSHTIPYVKNNVLSHVNHKYTGELGQAIDEINARYSMLMMGGKHRVYDHVEQRVSEPESVRVYESTQIFHDSKMVNPASIWVNDKLVRRNFDNAIFKPYRTNDQTNPRHFNHWFGWNVSYVDDMLTKEFEEYVQPWLDHIPMCFARVIKHNLIISFIGWHISFNGPMISQVLLSFYKAVRALVKVSL